MESNVISQVCAHQEEPVWITNIKKGVLSSLQSSVPTNELGVNITEVCLGFIFKILTYTHRLKITQNVEFEVFNFGVFRQFLSY